MAIERRPTGLVIVMEDPGDEKTVAGIEDVLGTTVLPAVAGREELLRLVDQMYGPPKDDGDWAGEDIADDDARSTASAREAERPPLVQLDDLLDRVMRVGGSDLHLAVGSPPAVRVQGELRRMRTWRP